MGTGNRGPRVSYLQVTPSYRGGGGGGPRPNMKAQVPENRALGSFGCRVEKLRRPRSPLVANGSGFVVIN